MNNFGEVLENASLENYNTYGIKTSCDYLVKVNSEDNLVNLMDFLEQNNYKYYLLGKGSNVILPDNHFKGVIISLELLKNIEINGDVVFAEAGITLNNLVKKCMENNLAGLEYFFGIPGSLGGAIYGNAGAHGKCIFDYLESVTVIRNKKIITLKKEDIKYSYRYSEFKENNDIILRGVLKLSFGNKEEMEKVRNEITQKRLNSQPLEYKNAGSVFKNPEGYFAGKLIEDLNLKGYAIGDAEISSKHANFIINKGNATSKDILDLIEFIKGEVKKNYNIELELEQIIVRW